MRRGFSLVEVLTVIGVVGLLSAILFPVLGIVRSQGRRAETISNLHQMGLAIAMYRQDNGGQELGTAEDMGLPVPYPALYVDNRLSWSVGRCTSGRISADIRFNGLQLMYLNAAPEPWERVVRRYGENSIVIAAMCFSDPNVPLNSPYFEYDALGLALGGNVRAVRRKGDWINQSWWQK